MEVFESAPVPGGMLYLGIPQFRLPREIIKMEVDNILAMGVTLHTRVTLGRDISFADCARSSTRCCWPPDSTRAAN